MMRDKFLGWWCCSRWGCSWPRAGTPSSRSPHRSRPSLPRRRRRPRRPPSSCARAQGDRDPEGRQQPPGRGPLDAFTAVISYESPSRLGPPLVYTTKSEVTLQRPDKLRVITPGDGPASEFYYDGKTMMAFEPAANLVAVAEAPPTIDAALKAAYDSAAIYFPFTDVIVADPYKGIADGLKLAFYIGQSRVVGGTTTDIVAIVNNWVFEQIWIGAEDKLPRKVRAVFLADPRDCATR